MVMDQGIGFRNGDLAPERYQRDTNLLSEPEFDDGCAGQYNCDYRRQLEEALQVNADINNIRKRLVQVQELNHSIQDGVFDATQSKEGTAAQEAEAWWAREQARLEQTKIRLRAKHRGGLLRSTEEMLQEGLRVSPHCNHHPQYPQEGQTGEGDEREERGGGAAGDQADNVDPASAEKDAKEKLAAMSSCHRELLALLEPVRLDLGDDSLELPPSSLKSTTSDASLPENSMTEPTEDEDSCDEPGEGTSSHRILEDKTVGSNQAEDAVKNREGKGEDPKDKDEGEEVMSNDSNKDTNQSSHEVESSFRGMEVVDLVADSVASEVVDGSVIGTEREEPAQTGPATGTFEEMLRQMRTQDEDEVEDAVPEVLPSDVVSGADVEEYVSDFSAYSLKGKKAPVVSERTNDWDRDVYGVDEFDDSVLDNFEMSMERMIELEMLALRAGPPPVEKPVSVEVTELDLLD